MPLPCQDAPLLVKIESSYDWHWWLTVGIQTGVPVLAVLVAFWIGHSGAIHRFRTEKLQREIDELEELKKRLTVWTEDWRRLHIHHISWATVKTEAGVLRDLVTRAASTDVAIAINKAIDNHLREHTDSSRDALLTQAELVEGIAMRKHEILRSLHWWNSA